MLMKVKEAALIAPLFLCFAYSFAQEAEKEPAAVVVLWSLVALLAGASQRVNRASVPRSRLRLRR